MQLLPFKKNHAFMIMFFGSLYSCEKKLKNNCIYAIDDVINMSVYFLCFLGGEGVFIVGLLECICRNLQRH